MSKFAVETDSTGNMLQLAPPNPAARSAAKRDFGAIDELYAPLKGWRKQTALQCFLPSSLPLCKLATCTFQLRSTTCAIW